MIEKKFEIVMPDFVDNKEDLLIKRFGEHFNMRKFIEDTESTESVLSSIRPISRLSSPFNSGIELDKSSRV